MSHISKSIICIFIVSFLSISCQKKDTYTSILSKYLLKEFELKIPERTHYFVLLSGISCKGCVEKTQRLLIGYLLQNPELLDNMTFIYSDRRTVNPLLIQKTTSYYDSFEILDRLPLPIENIIIIKTDNRITGRLSVGRRMGCRS